MNNHLTLLDDKAAILSIRCEIRSAALAPILAIVVAFGAESCGYSKRGITIQGVPENCWEHLEACVKNLAAVHTDGPLAQINLWHRFF